MPIVLAGSAPVDPFAFFHPSVVVGPDERERLDRGDAGVRILPSDDGKIAAFAAVRVNADGHRPALWVSDIEEFKRSMFVKAIARFSDPPRLEDLDALVLDEEDLQAG